MAINSKIIFCKNIKLDRSNNNVLTLSEYEMLELVNSNGIKVAESNDYSFIGKGDRDAIDVSLNYNTLLGCNYIAFQNSNYNNKWYFAFIDDIEFINPGTSRVHYTVDIFATWWSYWSPKACFVSRENVNDDTPGLHTLPESLELGEHIIQSGNAYVDQSAIDFTDALHYLRDVIIVIGLTNWFPRDYAVPGITVYNGLYSGVKYYAFKTATDAEYFIQDVQTEFSSDPIESIFIVPSNLANIDDNDWETIEGYRWEFAYYPFSERAIQMGDEIGIAIPDHLDTNYVPINKKLLTFPYCYLLISNNAGSVKEYRYEWFNNNVYCDFKIYGSVLPGCSIKLYPTGYNMKNATITMEARNNYEALDAPKLPTCSWANDVYTNWLTQNSVNLALNNVKNVGSIVAGGAIALATGGTAAALGGVMAVSGFSGIFEDMKQKYEHSLAPDTVRGGSNQGNLIFGMYDTFTANRMSIRKEYAEIIDNFFSKFGYQINKIKLPNQVGRRYWNYVQIGNGEVLAYQKPDVVAIPADDLVNINKLYQRGITLWHDHTNLGDYTLSNDIINPPTPPTPPPTPTPETTIINTDITAPGVDTSKESYINILGNTLQDGDPTPDNPVDIQVVTDNNIIQVTNEAETLQKFRILNLGTIELCKIGDYQDGIYKSTGKNLFDKSTITENHYLTSTGEIGNSTNWSYSDYIKVEEGQQYTYQGITERGTAPYSCYYDSSKTFISSFRQNLDVNTITIPSGVCYVRFSICHKIGNMDTDTFMLEKGTTNTPYEPYGDNTWYIKKEIGKDVLDGSENWTLGSASSNDYYVFQKNVLLDNNTGVESIYSNNFTNAGYQGASTTLDYECIGMNSSNHQYIRIWIKGDRLTEKTASAFKTWLQSHNTEVYYVLANPTYTTITDSTLIEQLNRLYTVTLYDGTNYITTITNNLKPYIKLHYNIDN